MTAGSIDLNADVGEAFGAWPMGVDAELIPLVSSVNIACGFHAGDPVTMERTIALAIAAGVSIGAHPGYPDLAGFGRRDMALSAAELEASVVYQVAALSGMVRAAGAEVGHVKAHGALYNRAAVDAPTAEAIARAVARCSQDLILVGLAGSRLLEAAARAGLGTAAEAFPDRSYEADGRLTPRSESGAVLEDSEVVAARAVAMARDGVVVARGGVEIRVRADTLCLHGDTPGVIEHARAVRAALTAAGIDVRAPGR